jgi:hypothetical protein
MKSKKNMKNKQRGRPPEGRKPLMVHILPKTITTIDGMVVGEDRQRNTRGKCIEFAIQKYTEEP